MKLLVPLKGSIQNPTFSPEGKSFLFTRFRGGYGIGAADLYVADLRERERVTLVTKGELEGCTNVCSPGFRSTWNNDVIIFASQGGKLRLKEWPHLIHPDGSGLMELPGRQDDYRGVAPTMSPSGEEFAFQRHKSELANVEGPGEIVIGMVNALAEKVVSTGDSRNPSWSPDGTMLAWQTLVQDRWRLAIHHIESNDTKLVTPAGKSFGRPTWHPDSDALLCGGNLAMYQVTTTGNVNVAYGVEHGRIGYLGAGSWSPETIRMGRRRLMCEGTDRDSPAGGPGTWLEIY